MKGSGSMLGAAILAAVLGGKGAAASPAACDMRLSVELTPDVPNPLDSGFLSSLLNNQTSYRLTFLGLRPGSAIGIELTGPSPEYLCRNVVDEMRKDGRVLSIHIDRESAVTGLAALWAFDQAAASDTTMHGLASGAPRRTLDVRPPDLRSLPPQNLPQAVSSSDADSQSDAAETVAIAAAPWFPKEDLGTELPSAGIASLYWALRHPPQAWRVVLPVQLDGEKRHDT